MYLNSLLLFDFSIETIQRFDLGREACIWCVSAYGVFEMLLFKGFLIPSEKLLKAHFVPKRTALYAFSI